VACAICNSATGDGHGSPVDKDVVAMATPPYNPIQEARDMNDTEQTVEHVEALRQELAGMGPLSPSVLASIRERYDYELTYTSNAIEGNTLTQRETEQVIAHGVTIGGKKVSEHLEALDHHEALKWMYAVAAS
jgi:Fic family protein